MKKFLAIFFCLSLVGFFVYIGEKEENNHYTEYLRIHIRANSNEQVDQDIKYQIKDEIVDYLTPIISTCTTKSEFESKLNQNLLQITRIANKILAHNNLDYESTAQITNEFFPVRTYGNLTLDSGYYDALIVNLGTGTGDNWWCVVYPPLCFVGENTTYSYKSRLLEVIKKFFGG